MNTSTAMLFRKEQIERFCSNMQEAISFIGPNQEVHEDEFISAVIEEVQASESDLTEARVAIEKYIISSLAKDPDDLLMRQIHEKAMPVINDVIDIEIKMHGRPLYIVSAANNNAQAYSLSNLASNPISTITVPQDVAQEVAKYGFINVTADTERVIDLPDQEDINEYRTSFFNSIDDDTKEEQWLKDFEQEKFFAIVDNMLSCINQFEQVSLFISQAVKDVFKSELSSNQIKYVQDCFVPEFEVQSTKFIISARNSSLRYFFTALQFITESKEQFFEFVKQNHDKQKQLLNYHSKGITKDKLALYSFNKIFDALIDLSSKHPLLDENLEAICLFLEFCIPELRDHFYLALNDTAAYYEERKFFVSSSNCYLLKEYLASNFEIKDTKEVQQRKDQDKMTFIDELLFNISNDKTIGEQEFKRLCTYIEESKSEKIINYEQQLLKLDRVITIDKKVINTGNLRVLALLDLLKITEHEKDKFFTYLTDKNKTQHQAKTIAHELCEVFKSLINKDTLNKELFKHFKLWCDFISQDERNRYYKALNESYEYYEESSDKESSQLIKQTAEYLKTTYGCIAPSKLTLNNPNSQLYNDSEIGVFFG